MDSCVGALGSHDESVGPSNMIVLEARQAMAHALMTSKFGTSSSLSGILVELLSAWRMAAGDWDDQPEHWLVEGAPMGLTHHPKCPRIFPLRR